MTYPDITRTWARKIAALAPVVHRVHKEMVQTVLDNPALAGLTAAQQALAMSPFDTEDFQEGWRAFLEKRPPQCRGCWTPRRGKAMEFGICVPHYGKPVDIASTLGVARSAEELGFASVWVTDHLFVPRTMEIIYRDNMLEPLALLSHLAAVVSRVRLGTSVMILPYRNPIIVAKMLATIDQLSHGRLIFGAAVGWMEEEFHALKVPFAERGALSDESLRIIRDNWTGGVVNHQGTFYQYADMQASPRPVQQPGPPIWIGGNSARARRRVAELGDGWHTSSLNAAAMAPGCAHVRELWEKQGRQGQPVFSARTDLTIEGVSDRVLSYPPRAGRPPRMPMRGSVGAIVDALGAFQEIGVEHIVFETSTQSHNGTLATMEAFMQKVQPQLA